MGKNPHPRFTKPTPRDLYPLSPPLPTTTGTDLDRHGQTGAVFAGIHADLNLLTIHGASRFPGLFIWLRDGRRVPVKVPPGCLLIQAGRQLEHVTGGYIQAGFHEVVFTDETQRAMDAARAEGRSTWRVSSTVLAHVASDRTLRVLGNFANEEACMRYPDTLAGEQVSRELESIALKKKEEGGVGADVRVAMG